MKKLSKFNFLINCILFILKNAMQSLLKLVDKLVIFFILRWKFYRTFLRFFIFFVSSSKCFHFCCLFFLVIQCFSNVSCCSFLKWQFFDAWHHREKKGIYGQLGISLYTGYLTTECGFCRPWCARGMPVTYFFRI